MRVTFCLKTANRSGGVKVVAQYAERLARRGHEVTVVSGPEPPPRARLRLSQALRSILSGRGLPPPHVVFPSSALDAVRGVRHHRVSHAPPFTDDDFPDADVVVATWWETAEWVASLSPRKGAKAYFIQGHESTIDGMPSERVEATLDLPLHPITIAEFLVKHLRHAHGRDEVSLVPNAVDLEHFQAPPRGKQARPTVGCIYTDSWIKGFDVTRAALEELRHRLPDLRVVSFGATRPSRPLPAFFDHVVDPPQSAIPELYASMDVFAHGSRVEGFGLPILEAMACRTPVVSTPSGAAPELLAEGRGRLLEGVDSRAMARELLGILRMPESEWRALSDRAHAHAHSYTLDDATSRFERALARAIEVQR